MQLAKLHCNNFGSFKELDFSLPGVSGLYLITGSNEENPRSGSNGLGKSTLFNAICWVLYGKIPNGAKASELLNTNQGKGYKAEIDYFGHHILRSWNPNGLKLDGVEV